MSDTNSSDIKDADTRHINDDDIDEELLALSPPPPNPKFLLLVSAILTMSVVMMVWFFPDLKYLLEAFREPQKLGEAADIDPKTLRPNSSAEVEGFPLIQRTLTYKEGVKWFTMSDNTRKFFPLAGQPHLYVQWAETAAHKAYRDPETNPGAVGPPSVFKGHLVTREMLGPNYDGIWVFYDCLKYHYLGRCNYCLGRTSLDECRKAFVCAESNEKEACEEILSKSEGALEKEQAAAEKSGNKEALERVKQTRLALRENAILTRFTTLEELDTKAARLQKIAAAEKSPLKASLSETRAAILNLRAKELEIRATDALRTTKALDNNAKQKLLALHKEHEKLTADEASMVAGLKTMKLLVQIGDSVERWKKRAADLMDRADLLSDETVRKMSRFDPDTQKGDTLGDALSLMESKIAAARQKSNREDAPASPDDADKTSEKTDEKVVSAEDNTQTSKVEEKPARIQLKEKLSKLIKRLRALEIRLGGTLPGRLPELEKWAQKPDVLGNVPDALMERRVLRHIAEIERMTASAPSSAATDDDDDKNPELALARQMNDDIDALGAVRTKIKSILSTPGFYELKIADRLGALQKSIKDTMSLDEADRAAKEIDGLIAEMITHNLYLLKIKGAPEKTAELDALVPMEKLDSLKVALAEPTRVLKPADFVLIDGEIPLDKLWVVLIYLALLGMTFINIRKIVRFVAAYKK